MGVDISLEGDEDLLGWIERAGKNVEKAADEALKAAALAVLTEAELNLQALTIHHTGSKYYMAASVRKGKLLKSLKISSVKKGQYGGKYIRVYSNHPTAHLVELGHSGDTAPAHPFLGPAYERNREKIKDIIRNKLVEALQNEL